jgi:hypothetical protein
MAGLFFVVALVGMFALHERGAEATHVPDHDGMQAMSIDLDIAGNDATSLGARDGCLEVAPGQTVVFDITAEGIPVDYPMLAFHTVLGFAGALTVESYDLEFLLAASPGSQIYDPTIGGEYPPGTRAFEAVDISDLMTIPPEFGSGVLVRITATVNGGVQPGSHVLTLKEAVHIGPTNQTPLASTVNGAVLVVGGSCVNPPPTVPPTPLPTPTPVVTPTPTETPAATPTPVVTPTPQPSLVLPAVLAGLDHDGGAPNIDDDILTLGPGQVRTLRLVVQPNNGVVVGAWQGAVVFRADVLEILDCVGLSGTVCNAQYAAGEVRLSGASVAGLSVATAIAELTFRAAEIAATDCTGVGPHDFSVWDTVGSELSSLESGTYVCVLAGPTIVPLSPTPIPPSPGSTPSEPTPTATPPYDTPAPTLPPFPSPTPGGTAGPTPPPGGGPPVFDPGGSMCFENISTSDWCDGDSAPGGHPDLMYRMCVGWGQDCDSPPDYEVRDSGFETVVNFLPSEFNPGAGDTPVGAISGYVSQNMVMGLLNGPCSSAIAVSFSMLNASTNQADRVQRKPEGQPNPMEPLAMDVNPQNGIPDGADRYPDFLADYLYGLQPHERFFGATKIQGGWMTYNVLVFAPGAHIHTTSGLDMAFDPALGYPVLFVFDDPGRVASPNEVTDICSPIRTAMMLLGRTYDNPCTPLPSPAGGNCPDSVTTVQNSGYPFLPCESINSVDEDGDGVVNDGCLRVGAQAESGADCLNAASDDGEDSSINDGCPAVGDVPENARAGDCIGADEGGCAHHTNPPAPGAYDFTTMVSSYWDADNDGIDNALDACDLNWNPDWDPRTADVDDDPDSDGLLNACDPNPGVASPMTPVSCPTGVLGPDEDQDCAPNRGDNCPDQNQLANPSAPPGTGNPPLMLDRDHDGLGDACDPTPEVVNGERVAYCVKFALVVGGPPGPVTGTLQGSPPECVPIIEHPAVPDPTPIPGQALSEAGAPAAADPVAVQPAALPQTGGQGAGHISPLWLVALAAVEIASVVFLLRIGRYAIRGVRHQSRR